MARFTSRQSAKRGLPPGTAVHIGERKVERTRITVITFSETAFNEREAASADELPSLPAADAPGRGVTWINVDGVHDVALLEAIGSKYGLHPLSLEDIANTGQRPKLEEYDGYLYLVARMITPADAAGAIASEQISFVLARGLVLTFQETVGDVFDPIRQRIRTAKGRIRKMGADYLAYSLLDAIVDHYFVVLERVGESLQLLEDQVVLRPAPQMLQRIHRQKRNMVTLRRSVWPLREVVNSLERGESALIAKPTRLFLRDVYDHTIQVVDTVETYRDVIAGLLDIYLSSVSNRMNQVMKTLTIIATIFMPLTFLAGVYGMNFQYMPETRWHYGYFIALGVMTVLGVLMFLAFRRKRWL